jgi:integrin alpha FG-GAP repeat containing protein 1
MTVDFIAYTPESKDKLMLWKNDPINVSKLYSTHVSVFICNPHRQEFKVNSTRALCKLADPHSSAFADFDGDCLADLLIVCKPGPNEPLGFQIWTNGKENGFHFAREGQFPKGTGELSFADMDGDGTLDMVFPVCLDNSCAIHIVHNRQKPLCSNSITADCRSVRDLCVADDTFHFNLPINGQNVDHVVIPMDQLFPDKHYSLLVQDTDFVGHLPVAVQVGDYNIDGFPDLLIVTVETSTKLSTPRLLRSIPCTTDLCKVSEVELGRRRFEWVQEGTEPLTEIIDARKAVFLDLDEDVCFPCFQLTCNRAHWTWSSCPSHRTHSHPPQHAKSCSLKTTLTMTLSFSRPSC